MAACGACKVRAEDSVFNSGTGATTACENPGVRFVVVGSVSGAGAIAATGSVGNLRFAAAAVVDASGTVGWGWIRDQATIFGSGTSWFSLTSEGVTIVWLRLSASGGTEMIDCGAYSGAAF